MARIQILELPSEVVGDEVVQPFALILDQVADDHVDGGAWTDFGVAIGARAVAIFHGIVELPTTEEK